MDINFVTSSIPDVQSQKTYLKEYITCYRYCNFTYCSKNEVSLDAVSFLTLSTVLEFKLYPEEEVDYIVYEMIDSLARGLNEECRKRTIKNC